MEEQLGPICDDDCTQGVEQVQVQQYVYWWSGWNYSIVVLNLDSMNYWVYLVESFFFLQKYAWNRATVMPMQQETALT